LIARCRFCKSPCRSKTFPIYIFGSTVKCCPTKCRLWQNVVYGGMSFITLVLTALC
jgi:hypothetical protein